MFERLEMMNDSDGDDGVQKGIDLERRRSKVNGPGSMMFLKVK